MRHCGQIRAHSLGDTRPHRQPVHMAKLKLRLRSLNHSLSEDPQNWIQRWIDLQMAVVVSIEYGSGCCYYWREWILWLRLEWIAGTEESVVEGRWWSGTDTSWDFNLNNLDPQWFIFQLSAAQIVGETRRIFDSKPGRKSLQRNLVQITKTWRREKRKNLVELLMVEGVHCSCIAWTSIQCSVSAMHPLHPSHHQCNSITNTIPPSIPSYHPVHAMLYIITKHPTTHVTYGSSPSILQTKHSFPLNSQCNALFSSPLSHFSSHAFKLDGRRICRNSNHTAIWQFDPHFVCSFFPQPKIWSNTGGGVGGSGRRSCNPVVIPPPLIILARPAKTGINDCAPIANAPFCKSHSLSHWSSSPTPTYFYHIFSSHVQVSSFSHIWSSSLRTCWCWCLTGSWAVEPFSGSLRSSMEASEEQLRLACRWDLQRTKDNTKTNTKSKMTFLGQIKTICTDRQRKIWYMIDVTRLQISYPTYKSD